MISALCRLSRSSAIRSGVTSSNAALPAFCEVSARCRRAAPGFAACACAEEGGFGLELLRVQLRVEFDEIRTAFERLADQVGFLSLRVGAKRELAGKVDRVLMLPSQELLQGIALLTEVAARLQRRKLRLR